MSTVRNRTLRRATSKTLGCLAALCTIFATSQLRAQLATTRGLFLTSGDDSTRGARVLSRVDLFAGYEQGTANVPTFQSSSYKLGALIDVVHFTPGIAFGVILGNEVTVTPDNSIRFDPRGVVLEEQAIVFSRGGRLRWSASTFWRCRHDVDNGNTVESRSGAATILAGGRVIILPGVQLGGAWQQRAPSPRVSVRVASSIEAYLAPTDRRTPDSAYGSQASFFVRGDTE